jgi:type IV secretion system protein VirB1
MNIYPPICLLLFLPPALAAQTIDIGELRARCLPEAPDSTLRAIVQLESRGNPNAMQIDFPQGLLRHWKLDPGALRLARQPKDRQQATEWLSYLQKFHVSVDLGVMQVSTAEAQRRGIAPMTLFEPCTNLRVGWEILQDAYQLEIKVHGPGQTALEHALSRYNTGDSERGFDNGYVRRVLAALRIVEYDSALGK